MIPLIKTTFYKEQKTKRELIKFIKSATKLSMGDECQKFESAFAKKQMRKFSVFVSSGSAANLLLIQSLLNLGLLKIGDKVAFSALTWATNVMPIIQLGLKPIPIDCELTTLNSSVNTLKKKSKYIKAFFATNVLGLCDNITQIKQFCLDKKIIFIEDNCEGLGSKFNGMLLGNFGLASTFSFYVGHHLSTIEGGMICTDDEKLYEMLLMVRAHGWDRNLSHKKRLKLRKYHHINPFFGHYTFYDLAYNCRPTEIQGHIGNLQLPYLETIVTKREKHFKQFQTIMQNNSHFIPLMTSHMDVISNFAVPVVFRNRTLFKKYRKKFTEAGVEIRPIIAGDISTQPFYKKHVSKTMICKNARFIHQTSFYFPNNPELTNYEIELICTLLMR